MLVSALYVSCQGDTLSTGKPLGWELSTGKPLGWEREVKFFLVSLPHPILDDEHGLETQIQHAGLDGDCDIKGKEEDPQQQKRSGYGPATSSWNFSCSTARLPGCEAEFAVGNAAGQ